MDKLPEMAQNLSLLANLRLKLIGLCRISLILTAKTAMRRVLGISVRGGQGETLVPPTAVAGGDEGFVFESEASDNNNSG